MENAPLKNSAKTFFSYLSFKNVFLAIFVLSFAPGLIKTIQKYVENTVRPNTHVGCLVMQGAIMDSTFYVKHIHKFLKNDDIKALLVKIKSPGGLPGAAQSIFNELLKFKEKKPIVVEIEDMAASAGYYIATAADRIVANPSALIGSIGVRMTLGNVADFLKYHQIEVTELAAGKYKTTTSFLRGKTPDELIYLQELIDDAYQQFIKDVAAHRNLSLDQHAMWANGRIFSGNKALELKLVDKIGSISEAKEELTHLIVERGGVVEGKIKFIYPPRQSGFARLFAGGDDDENGTETWAKSIARFGCNVYDSFITLQEERSLQLK